MEEDKKYQIITILLSDGRKLSATVPEFCKEGDKLFIHPQFEVSEPRCLPEGYGWSNLQTPPPNKQNVADLL